MGWPVGGSSRIPNLAPRPIFSFLAAEKLCERNCAPFVSSPPCLLFAVFGALPPVKIILVSLLRVLPLALSRWEAQIIHRAAQSGSTVGGLKEAVGSWFWVLLWCLFG